MLQVRAPGHDRGAVRVGLRGERVDEVHELLPDRRGVVLEVQPHERGDLVVAAAARAELAAELGADDADERGLERAVHVLVGVARDDLARGDPWTRACRGPRACRRAPPSVEVPGRGERAGVRTRPGEVVGRELPVEVRRLREPGELGRRPGGEAGAPERALVRAVLAAARPVASLLLGHQASFRSSSHTSSAFWACSRFSASSQMIDCSPSITSAVTSYPRSAGRQCMNTASDAASDMSSRSTR